KTRQQKGSTMRRYKILILLTFSASVWADFTSMDVVNKAIEKCQTNGDSDVRDHLKVSVANATSDEGDKINQVLNKLQSFPQIKGRLTDMPIVVSDTRPDCGSSPCVPLSRVGKMSWASLPFEIGRWIYSKDDGLRPRTPSCRLNDPLAG